VGWVDAAFSTMQLELQLLFRSCTLTSLSLEVVLVSFYPCDKIPEINNLKPGKVYFGSQFQKFQPIVAWFYHSGPVLRW
jgi:hypothetical protein